MEREDVVSILNSNGFGDVDADEVINELSYKWSSFSYAELEVAIEIVLTELGYALI